MIGAAKAIARQIFNIFWRIRVSGQSFNCNLCDSTDLEKLPAYGRVFLHCNRCGGIQARELPEFLQLIGMGVEGSWGGALEGGEREHYLANLLNDLFDSKSVLLYGSGATRAPLVLDKESFAVTALDVSSAAVNYLNDACGRELAYTHQTLPKNRCFDVVIACEVFEHFNDPNRWFGFIRDKIASDGVICGTTDFFNGQSIFEGNDRPGYMSFFGHTFYWSDKSMTWLAEKYGLRFLSFEMQCPGSVFADKQFGLLFPNKRVFFLTSDPAKFSELEHLKKRFPILPLDTRSYWEKIEFGNIDSLTSTPTYIR